VQFLATVGRHRLTYFQKLLSLVCTILSFCALHDAAAPLLQERSHDFQKTRSLILCVRCVETSQNLRFIIICMREGEASSVCSKFTSDNTDNHCALSCYRTVVTVTRRVYVWSPLSHVINDRDDRRAGWPRSTAAVVSSMPCPGNGFSTCWDVRQHNERLFVNGVASVTVTAVDRATSPIKTSPAQLNADYDTDVCVCVC